MSTKIYNAYKIDNMTMPEIMESLYKLKQLTHENIIKFMSDRVDHEKIIKKYNHSTFINMLKDVHSKNINSPFNWNSSVVLYFHKTNIYIIFFGVDVDINEIFNNNLVDYHYQNQSDPWYAFDLKEDTIEYNQAEIEWEERKRVWCDITGDRWQFSESGLCYDIFSEDDIFLLSRKLWPIIEGCV